MTNYHVNFFSLLLVMDHVASCTCRAALHGLTAFGVPSVPTILTLSWTDELLHQ